MRYAAAALLFLAAGCASIPAQSRESAAVVERFVAAFNAQDVEAMLALTTPDVEWLTVTGAAIAVETSGAEQLRSSMTRYFRSCPSCRSSVTVNDVNGPYVSAVERATFVRKGTSITQASTCVYELREGRVRRVWYYPSVK